MEEYKNTRKMLRIIIKKATNVNWKTICDRVNCDIWGDGYKIIMKPLKGFPQRRQITMELTEEVVKHLFPKHIPVHFVCNRTVIFLESTLKKLELANNKLKLRKGPAKYPS